MKTIAIGSASPDALMRSQSDAINSSLASNSGHRESVNSIKVDYQDSVFSAVIFSDDFNPFIVTAAAHIQRQAGVRYWQLKAI